MDNKDNDLAKSCECGSTNFSLLKSGAIECNKCGSTLKSRWAQEDSGTNLHAYAVRMSGLIKKSGSLECFHWSEVSTVIDEILKYSIIGGSK